MKFKAGDRVLSESTFAGTVVRLRDWEGRSRLGVLFDEAEPGVDENNDTAWVVELFDLDEDSCYLLGDLEPLVEESAAPHLGLNVRGDGRLGRR